jgi:hypothetical protein
LILREAAFPLSIPSFLDRAGRWFLESGIQEPGGGVARYFRTDTRENLPISNEITGYTVSALVYLHARTGYGLYLDKAIEAAQFLTRLAWDREAQTFAYEYAPPGNALAYFFDCGIIARGLLALWRATGTHEFLDVAAACGRSMLRDFAAGADFHPILRLPAKEPVPYDPRWSRSPGCYQLKSAMAWFDLYEETGNSEFRDAYHRVLDSSARTCGAFLPGDQDPHRVMDRLHAYCYFLEGLLPCAERKSCAALICDGIRRVHGYLAEIGPSFERSDVFAQLLRMRLLAEFAGVVPVDRDAARLEAERLAGFQSEAHGGFAFGLKAGQMLPFVNPVSSAFGLQALAMWHDYEAGAAPPDRRVLI